MPQKKNPGISFVLLFLFGALMATQSVAYAAAQFPFPRNKPYKNGILTKAGTTSRIELQKYFQMWDSLRYKEKNNLAAIGYGGTISSDSINVRFQSSDLGYGMLIMVYMDNAKNNTQPKFDKLLNAYDTYLDSLGLMHWGVRWLGVKDTVWGRYAATDADVNVALSLLMAYKQWGEVRYLNRAKVLINNIWLSEVDSALALKPGDMWNPYKNPAYLNFVALHLFAKVDNHDWASVLRNSWTLLKNNTSEKNSPARLPSDWCLADGTPSGEKTGWIEFHSEAVRVPLNVGLAWAWFGDADALPIDSNIAAFALSKKYSIQGRVDSIGHTYYLSGTRVGYGNSPYALLGAFTVAGMVHSRYQAWVDTGYEYYSKKSGTDYFGTVHFLGRLFASGNFNNFWDSTSFKPVGLSAVSPLRGPRLTQTGKQLRVEFPANTGTAQLELFDAAGVRQWTGNVLLSQGEREISLPTGQKGLHFLRWKHGEFSGSMKLSFVQ